MLLPVENVLATVSAVFILLTMTVVAADVVMRYLFNAPLAWSFDVVSMYLLTGGFFLALPSSYEQGSHVRVDILVHRYPRAFRRACEMVSCACGMFVLGAIAFVAYQRTVVSFVNGDAVVGLFAWPTWPSTAFVAVGAGLLALRLAISIVRHGLSLVASKELIELPVSSEQRAYQGESTE